jgi:hypothetical protein
MVEETAKLVVLPEYSSQNIQDILDYLSTKSFDQMIPLFMIFVRPNDSLLHLFSWHRNHNNFFGDGKGEKSPGIYHTSIEDIDLLQLDQFADMTVLKHTLPEDGYQQMIMDILNSNFKPVNDTLEISDGTIEEYFAFDITYSALTQKC